MAPDGQVEPHVPHPLQSTSFTSDAFLSRLNEIALYGQTFIQVWHPQQSASLTEAVVTSTATDPCAIVASILAAAARACDTESAISFGPWHDPTI